MRPPSKPLFVERADYRRRRMGDAARLLPILGIVLFALPMLWRTEGGGAALTSHVIAYIFVVWLVFVLLGAALSAYLAAHEGPSDEDEGS